MKNLGFLAYLIFVVLLTLKGQIMAGESSGESAKNTVAWFSKPTLAMSVSVSLSWLTQERETASVGPQFALVGIAGGASTPNQSVESGIASSKFGELFGSIFDDLDQRKYGARSNPPSVCSCLTVSKNLKTLLFPVLFFPFQSP